MFTKKNLLTTALAAVAWMAFFGISGAQQMKTKRLLLPFHTEPVKVTYEVIDGWAVMEEDIVLGKDNELFDIPEGAIFAIAHDEEARRWRNGVMPYVINAEISGAHRQNILDAMAHIEESTSVSFVARTSQADYVEFNYHNYSTHFCLSTGIGRNGGRQFIRLHRDGCGIGTTIHEICHALGFWHEQAREDRNQFVEILWDNIIESQKSQFSQHITDGMDIGRYDYGSIMHYRSTSFSKNGQPTIRPLQPDATIGQRTGLSDGDIDAINLLYPPIQGRVTGVFRKEDSESRMWVGANWDNFTKKWKDFGDNGYRLTDLEVRKKGNGWVYDGVWEKGNDKHALYRFKTWDDFTAKWADLRQDGYRLMDIETFKSGDERWYVGAWRAGSGGYGLFKFNSWNDLVQKREALKNDNLRLIDVEAFEEGSSLKFVGVWVGGTDESALYRFDTWAKFTEKWGDLSKANQRMIDFELVKSGSKTWYIGVFRSGSDGHAFWHNTTWSSFARKQAELAKQNIFLIDFEVH